MLHSITMSAFKKDEKGDYVECEKCGDIVRSGWCRCKYTGLFAPRVEVISEEVG